MNKITNFRLVFLILFLAISKSALSIELAFEKVYKVDIPNHVYKNMNTNQILSKLETFLMNNNFNDLVADPKIRKAMSAQFIQDKKGVVKQVELITTSNNKTAINALHRLKIDLDEYVKTKMVKEFIEEQNAKKIIKSVQFDDLIVDNLSNDEIQFHLNNFFNNSKAFANPELKKYPGRIEIKIVANDKTMKIWLIELISILPKDLTDRLLNPAQKELSKFVSTVMVAAAKEKIKNK